MCEGRGSGNLCKDTWDRIRRGEPLPKKILETGRQAAKERKIYFEWELSFCLVGTGRIHHLFSNHSIFRPNGYR